MYIYIYICMYVWIYIRMYVCMHVCMYVYTFVYVCTHARYVAQDHATKSKKYSVFSASLLHFLWIAIIPQDIILPPAAILLVKFGAHAIFPVKFGAISAGV